MNIVKKGCLSHTILTREEFSGIVTLFRFIPFSKNDAEIWKFSDYVIGYEVIGHDVIGIPVVHTDNTGVGQYGIENRLIIHGLQQMFWPN